MHRLPLILGFTALAVALAAAVESPARAAELSIYQSTPTVYWVGITIAVVAALVVTIATTSSRWERGAGYLLAGSAVWSVVALPLVRGYYFYGAGDALTHLGFARSFDSGALSPTELLHPGIHLVSIGISRLAGFDLPASIMFTVFLFFVVFFVFVPLTVRRIAGSDRALIVGLLSALLLLPINHVATHVIAHPSSQMILFAPFVLFLLILYVRQASVSASRLTSVGGLLAVTSASIVLFHPQEALNVLAIFGSVALVQFAYRRYDPDHPISEHRSIYLQTVFLGVLLLLWAPRSERFQSRFELLLETLSGSGGAAGTEVSSYSVSLAGVGGSIEELFVKLFLASLVFSVVAGLFILGTISGRFDDVLPERNAHARYLTVGFVPITVAALLIYVGAFGDHYFRYIGFLMTLTTILGAVALAEVLPSLRERADRETLRTGAVVLLFLLLLPIAVMGIHQSPWMYQTTPHVSSAQMDGYETAFAHRDPSIAYAGIRSGPERYVDAVYGPESQVTAEFKGISDSVPPEVLGTNVTSYYDEPRYLAVTDSDVARETELYRGLRYDSAGLASLDSTPGIARVQATGEFQLYHVVDE